MEPFHFDPGELYIRTLREAPNREALEEKLHYELPGEPWHMQTLAEIQGSRRTRPSTDDISIEYVHVPEGRTETGAFVEHRLASEDDLVRFVRNWDYHHCTPHQWIIDVSHLIGLEPRELGRLERAVHTHAHDQASM